MCISGVLIVRAANSRKSSYFVSSCLNRLLPIAFKLNGVGQHQPRIRSKASRPERFPDLVLGPLLDPQVDGLPRCFGCTPEIHLIQPGFVIVGARADTAAEMAKTLHFTLSPGGVGHGQRSGNTFGRENRLPLCLRNRTSSSMANALLPRAALASLDVAVVGSSAAHAATGRTRQGMSNGISGFMHLRTGPTTHNVGRPANTLSVQRDTGSKYIAHHPADDLVCHKAPIKPQLLKHPHIAH